MKRVVIVGIPGAGKSTLARRLSAVTGLSLYHLDNLRHLPGWVLRPKDEVQREYDAIAAQDAWIAEGIFKGLTKNLRTRADVIIFLDFHPVYGVLQVLKRFIFHRLHISRRADLAEGFDENLNWEFIKWILTWRVHTRPEWIEELAQEKAKVLIFKCRAEVQTWLGTLA